MSDRAGERLRAHRRGVRAGLIGLAVPLLIVGGWALAAPRSFWDDFPGFGRHWVSALGPYDEHLVRDLGSLYLALGVLLLLAAVVLVRALVQGALVAFVVFQVPHTVFHSAKTEPLSTGDNIVNIVGLALGLALALSLLAAVSRRERPGTEARSAPGAGGEAVKGGVGYGTR